MITELIVVMVLSTIIITIWNEIQWVESCYNYAYILIKE